MLLCSRCLNCILLNYAVLILDPQAAALPTGSKETQSDPLCRLQLEIHDVAGCEETPRGEHRVGRYDLSWPHKTHTRPMATHKCLENAIPAVQGRVLARMPSV